MNKASLKPWAPAIASAVTIAVIGGLFVSSAMSDRRPIDLVSVRTSIETTKAETLALADRPALRPLLTEINNVAAVLDRCDVTYTTVLDQPTTPEGGALGPGSGGGRWHLEVTGATTLTLACLHMLSEIHDMALLNMRLEPKSMTVLLTVFGSTSQEAISL